MKQGIAIILVSLAVIAQSATIKDQARVKRQFGFGQPGNGFGSPQGGFGQQPGGFGQPGGFSQAPFGGFSNPFTFPGEFQPGPGQLIQGQPQGQPQPGQGQFNPNQGQFNPNQGQFNPNQGQFNPNQGQFNPNQGQGPQGGQQPTQFTQQQPTTPATTVSPQVQACSEQCVTNIPATYNPVCASDGTTYQNRELLDCNIDCGRRIQMTQAGACPGRNATTNRPRRK